MGDVLKKIDDLSTWEKPGTGRIGVDGYNWVYKVIKSRTYTLGDVDELSRKFMSKVSYLRERGLTPYIVFDGNKLPIKVTTSSGGEVQDTDDLGLAKGIDVDNITRRGGTKVTHEIVFPLIQTLIRNEVEYMVAPYEADPQLAFILREKLVDVILTADADLILYGCRKIIFDYDKNYYEYDSSRLKGSKLFGNCTKEMVLQACMLGGCDYLSNLPGVGLEFAIKTMKERKDMMTHVDDYLGVLKVLTPPFVNDTEKLEYIRKFRKAMNTYRHQRVYDRTNKAIVCLEDFPNRTNDDDPYIGPEISLTPPDTIEDIVNGSIHPITKVRMQVPVTHNVGGDVYSKVMIDEDELQRNFEMERLFKATSNLKVLQKVMLNAAQDHFNTKSKQISTDMELVVSCQKYEVDYDCDFFGKAGASFRDMIHNKIKEAKEYTTRLEEKVIKPLNALIQDASLQKAGDLAESYSGKRQEVEDDHGKLENLKQILQTSSLTTLEALSVIKNHINETSTILVHMSELKCPHCKKLAAIRNETI